MGNSETEIEQIAGRDDLNPQELRNLASQLAAHEGDEELIAAAAGILPGRILATYFSHLDNKLRDARQQDAKARAEMHYLALLQAQLDALDAEIAVLDADIWEMLSEHLSQEELEYLASLKDEDFKAQEEMRLMREKLENGEMSQAEFDAFEDRWNERAAKRGQRADTAQAFENVKDASHDQIERSVESETDQTGVANVEAAGELVGGRLDEVVLVTVDGRNDEGNNSRDNSKSELDESTSTGADDFFEPTAEPASAISTAQSIAPDTPMRDAAPDLKGHYQMAAADIEHVEPDAQAKFELAGMSAPTTGLG